MIVEPSPSVTNGARITNAMSKRQTSLRRVDMFVCVELVTSFLAFFIIWHIWLPYLPVFSVCTTFEVFALCSYMVSYTIYYLYHYIGNPGKINQNYLAANIASTMQEGEKLMVDFLSHRTKPMHSPVSNILICIHYRVMPCNNDLSSSGHLILIFFLCLELTLAL